MNRRGFTLLEVLVATVIMAIAVAGVLSALSTSMRNAARLTEYDRAALFARRKLDELLVMKQLPKHNIIEGAWDPSLTGGRESGWRARVTPFELPPNPSPGLQYMERIELQVWWRAGDTPKSFTLDGFRRNVLTPEDIATGALLPR